MDYAQAMLLSIIQGITEWLPVSSSGHLVIAQHFFKINAPVAFDAALHFGTLISVLVFMRKDLTGMLASLANPEKRNPTLKYLTYIILATIPVGVAGLMFKGFFESLFSNLSAVTAGLLFTGLLLFISERHLKSGVIDAKKALTIGLMQSIAIIPGVSRSGTTISTGLMAGVNREDAARFSFLLSIPAILGGVIVESGSLANASIDAQVVAAGVLASAIVGYLSLKLLWQTILQKRFHLFAYYCWALAMALVLAQIL
ncbi:MAG: undecaprenyl-diphosphate phosphatase [Candidatus Altiarchaeota archaeon]|nr:undecaprenyl-diphosphate phosphatase [Candidatus Altiarchaeota archaeon]